MRKRSVIKALAVAAPLALAAAPAFATGPVAAGFDANSVGRCDDCSYGSPSPVSPGFNMNFFGTTYSQFYVNNNGNITFNNSLSTYTPYGVGSGYTGQPIIAPFFADVDTRNSASGITSFGTGTYDGHNAFGVTWPGVGYYGSHADKLDTFQMILTDRSDVGAGDFDIFFNYDSIQWETGDASGGSSGYGGTSAAAGYSNGTGVSGTYYQFPGSLVNGALLDGGPDALNAGTNDGVTGQYLFQVRNGQVAPPPTPGGVPEPATWAMMLLGFFGLGTAVRRRRERAAAVA